MKERPPVLAHERFQASKAAFDGLDLDAIFGKIHGMNLWGSANSASGLGSEMEATARLRQELPGLLHDLGVRSVLDIPCGDFHWFSQVPLGVERYTGADIVEAVMRENRQRYSGEFVRLDLCADALPQADLVLCRDCLVHLSYANIQRAVANLKASGAQWLLTTHFVECEENQDITDGDWRMLNFERPPFHWPAPERLVYEGCVESGGGYADKVLALWPLGKIG